ncbi:MAG: 30S ribosomal protein S1 [Acidobacteria bacterium]|nr:30S ribosomal protein S1 [Acidobacteriota bacterium]
MPPTEKVKDPNDHPKGEKDLESIGMEELLEMYDEKLGEFNEGEIVKGRVVHVKPTEVVVDIGYKSEGIVPIEQVTDYAGNVRVSPGSQLDVFIEKLEHPSGYVQLSREKAERVLVWDELEKQYKAEETISGRVLDRVKGGLSVDVGVKAFLPGSLVDVRPVKNLDSLKGKELEFRIISFDKRRSNVVLSRRALLEEKHEKMKKETFERLEEGAKITGTVKNITDYGAFVDLGGVDGLLHITDVSWGRVNHPSEYFNVNDVIEVVVLKIDEENERVSLGYKQRTSDPWLDVSDRYPIGSTVHGKAVSLTDYGAFVELEEGVEGLVHISEMSWTRRVKPSKLLNVGDEIDAVVTDVDDENRRISLSLRALETNPWDTIEERYPVGATITGKVRNLTDFGAFVEVEDGIDGLVHISDMSWTRRLKHPSEVVKKGDEVTAKVTAVDASSQRLSLSIKEFMPNEWDDYARDRSIGDEVIGTISKITDFGLFVKMSEGVEGLIHLSEIERTPSDNLEGMFSPGSPIRARLIKMDWAEKKIGLSLRDVEPLSDDERAAWERGELESPGGERGTPIVQTRGDGLSETLGDSGLAALKGKQPSGEQAEAPEEEDSEQGDDESAEDDSEE